MGSVNVMENPSPAAVFMEHYIECIDSLPEDIQRNISQLRELDLLYHSKMSQISNLLELYNSSEDPASKQRFLTKIQRCLIKSQEFGDEKLQLISQIVEMADSRNLQIVQDAENIDAPVRRDSSPLVAKPVKPDLPLNFDDRRIVEKQHPQIKRPRRQKTPHERYADMQECLLKAEKIPKIEKTVKVEKAVKTEKKVKVVEKTEPAEPVPPVPTPAPEVIKKTAETSKKVVEATGKKKIVKKEVKKKNGTVKKKKKKEVPDIPIDPDEPTYCSCNQVSYGEMIGCDNEDCPIEWFHFNCVKLTTKPKGKWYCPDCTIERRERGKK